MNSFILAFRDYFKALTVPGTRPKIAYVNGSYTCFWWFKKSTIEKVGGEVIYG